MRLLGNPEITVGGQPLSLRSRETLMALLWSESSTKNAGVNLRATLPRLRRTLQPVGEVLLTETGKVGFDFSRTIDLDLAWLSAVALPETPAGGLANILEIDRGEFLLYQLV